MLGWQMAYVIPAVIQHFQSPQVSFNLCNQLFLFEKIPSLFFKKFLYWNQQTRAVVILNGKRGFKRILALKARHVIFASLPVLLCKQIAFVCRIKGKVTKSCHVTVTSCKRLRKHFELGKKIFFAHTDRSKPWPNDLERLQPESMQWKLNDGLC